jgi:phage terminase large subunit
VIEIRAQMPGWAARLREPHRFKSIRGGRGSAKSWTVARHMLLESAQRKLVNLCAREYQNSIADSVHALLKNQIADLGLASFYDVQQNTIRGKNGSLFIFSGLGKNIDSIKSKEGIDRVWAEEAQVISEESWSKLTPTIRKEGSEILLTWNPEHAEDPTYKRFVETPPPGVLDLIVNWQDNPWFPDVLAAEKDHLYAVDPESAAHIWGGEPLRYGDAQVLRGRYIVQGFEPESGWDGPYQGLDFGFATTPLAFVRCWVHGRKLYIEHEVAGLEIDNDDIPKSLDAVPRAREYVTRGDCSRPETISHLRRHGYGRVTACYKGKGSIEGGVEHLRSYEQIIIHPRCELAIEQARLYSFKVDRLTGDVKPDLDDKHDDIWDAVRYALEPIILRGKPKKKEEPPPPMPMDYRAQRAIAARQRRG